MKNQYQPNLFIYSFYYLKFQMTKFDSNHRRMLSFFILTKANWFLVVPCWPWCCNCNCLLANSPFFTQNRGYGWRRKRIFWWLSSFNLSLWCFFWAHYIWRTSFSYFSINCIVFRSLCWTSFSKHCVKSTSHNECYYSRYLPISIELDLFIWYGSTLVIGGWVTKTSSWIILYFIWKKHMVCKIFLSILMVCACWYWSTPGFIPMASFFFFKFQHLDTSFWIIYIKKYTNC